MAPTYVTGGPGNTFWAGVFGLLPIGLWSIEYRRALRRMEKQLKPLERLMHRAISCADRFLRELRVRGSWFDPPHGAPCSMYARRSSVADPYINTYNTQPNRTTEQDLGGPLKSICG